MTNPITPPPRPRTTMTCFKSAKERVLDSASLQDSGRHIAEKLMKHEGLVFERLFNFLGELEDRLNKLEILND